ncbi:glycoside hydrolase superfamily [Cercophora newfieldiana]|uniref:Glycoside hydrolase superfamily n=1 Tax=Cercophora newfieldiana TaxID=92897 RepID=A0AA39YQY5_9PEZI|nr:glycoside hydrolase superfamily [Cercophora newfieldiana]
MYPVDILNVRHESFALWVPASGPSFTSPTLIIGKLDQKSNDFVQIGRFPLSLSSDQTDLWLLAPSAISPPLEDAVYHYWYEIGDTSPEKRGVMLVTDPLAFAVDYRITRGGGDTLQPASVIKYRDGKLWPCDKDGSEPEMPTIPNQAALPSNNHLVIYELPVSWVKAGSGSRGVDVDIGTFKDVAALFDVESHGDHFSTIAAIHDEALLANLGINALELLPAADAKSTGEWGYATAHYFAPDYDLGSTSDLARLVDKIHSQNVRLFTDVVMAFGHDPYRYIDFRMFHLRPHMEQSNPDSYQSHANNLLRDGWGGESWRYIQSLNSYDPETGSNNTSVHPSWAFHRAHLARWMTDFSVGGLRLDSVNNIGNYDFIRSYKERAWELYNARYAPAADPSKFLVIGEELSMPVSMVRDGVLDALWNEPWQGRLRSAILGKTAHDNESFDWNVRKLVDCTLDDDGRDAKFTDGAQAVNYITSHDIEGWGKERLYNYLVNSGVRDVEKRAKLAFALLLTSVGIPMIFAGEEFCDQMDQSVDMGKKQTDPVNYSRKSDGGWRQELFDYVATLVKFRTKCPALGEDDTEFIHVDSSRGGKIIAWKRGNAFPVVVVVNFSDEDTPGSEYIVPNWPDRDAPGWREVSQRREVPGEWVGREPLMRWEAKIYTRWRD